MHKANQPWAISMLDKKRLALLLVLIFALHTSALAAPQVAPLTNAEKTARYFQTIRTQPSLLWEFLRKMPKGADLHNHLGGAIYAETFIGWAAQDNLCVDQSTLALAPPPCDAAKGQAAASSALKDPILYRRLIDSWSMRNWEYSGQSGHDHFFDTFGKFGAAGNGHTGDMLAEVASRAYAERVSYLELMTTADGGKASQIGRQVGWDEDLGRLREKLLANGLDVAVKIGRQALDEAEAQERAALQCGKAQADKGCATTLRYLYQVGRGGVPEQVFAQILTGFMLASVDARVVGLNLVQPEDWLVPMRDFSLHMRMLDYLHTLYPKVHITLHAGELTPGIVPPEGLRFHVRESVERGHAERIGHGVDIMQETEPIQLLQEMARRRVLVEICLTSNDVILGVRGKQHPLAMYLKYGVPVALATDDAGVARSEMWREYLRAVEDQGLDYLQLKTMARASLEYSFVGGASLWTDSQKTLMVQQCKQDQDGKANASPACQRFLASNERARLQWSLEESFAEFEREYAR
jgi:adenosine deaminase